MEPLAFYNLVKSPSVWIRSRRPADSPPPDSQHLFAASPLKQVNYEFVSYKKQGFMTTFESSPAKRPVDVFNSSNLKDVGCRRRLSRSGYLFIDKGDQSYKRHERVYCTLAGSPPLPTMTSPLAPFIRCYRDADEKPKYNRLVV